MKMRLFILLLMTFHAQLSYADAYIKLMCDESGSDVYVNGEIVGTYDDMPLEFILPPGEHLLEIRKDYGDQSYGYYKKTVKAGKIDIKVPVNASLKSTYPESYYYRKANTIKGAESYLKIYPNGKYAQNLKNFIEIEYAKKADSIQGAKEYLSKYPNGKYSKKINDFIEVEYADKAVTIETAKEYLIKYPNGKYSKKIVDFIENKYADKATTLAGANEYLAMYPQGKHREKVKSFIEQKYADKATTLIGAEEYIEKYPNGKYIAKFKDFVELQYAKRATTIKGAERYLAIYPNGKYKEDIKIIKDKIAPVISNIQENMVLVGKGIFKMGSKKGYDNERPVHNVNLTYDFYIGKYEVTQKEYKELMGNNPSYSKGDNLPVETVSWWDAIKYCNALNKFLGLLPAYNEKTGELLDKNGNATTDVTQVEGYRLPTEAEWEYAARGGNKSKNYRYSGGDDLDDVAWNLGAYYSRSKKTHPVGTKLPNELGLYEMDGNVTEWCQDHYDSEGYKAHSKINPLIKTQSTNMHVQRGLSFDSYIDESSRVTNRGYGGVHDEGFYNEGFRLSKTY